MSTEMDKYFAGTELYGDDFDLSSITDWYKDEETAYYCLTHSFTEYEYYAFNDYYAFSKLRKKQFDTCLAFGCANGDDVSPLAGCVARYVALEPAEKWWTDRIGGKPAQYIKPNINGSIPLADGVVDVAICLGVLHHIPNVSYVVSEISRVLRPNGVLVLREPIFSMGDWRGKRKGLTPRERGIPMRIIEKTLVNSGFQIETQKLCMMPTTPRIARLFGITNAFNSRSMVLIDRVMSVMMGWNVRYHRRNVFEKLAPTSLYVNARKSIISGRGFSGAKV